MTYKQLVDLVHLVAQEGTQAGIRLAAEMFLATTRINSPSVETYFQANVDDIRDLILAHHALKQSYDEREKVIERLTKEIARLAEKLGGYEKQDGHTFYHHGVKHVISAGANVPVVVLGARVSGPEVRTVENCPHRMDSKLTPGFWCATSRNSRCDLVRHYGNCQWLGWSNPAIAKGPTT